MAHWPDRSACSPNVAPIVQHDLDSAWPLDASARVAVPGASSRREGDQRIGQARNRRRRTRIGHRRAPRDMGRVDVTVELNVEHRSVYVKRGRACLLRSWLPAQRGDRARTVQRRSRGTFRLPRQFGNPSVTLNWQGHSDRVARRSTDQP